MTYYRAGSDRIEIHTDDPASEEFLDAFLDRLPDGGPSATPLATISMTDEILAPGSVPHGSVALGRLEGGYVIGRRFAAAPLDRGEQLGVLRKVIRLAWLVRHAPAGDFFYLHASAVDDGEQLTVFTGDKRGGKTTLMLDAVINHGCSMLTNDGLVVLRRGSRLTVAPLPTLVKIRGDVAERFAPALRERARDTFNTRLFDGWRAGNQPSLPDNPLFQTFGVLGDKFGELPVGERRVVVAGVQFGTPATVSAPLPPDRALELLAGNRKLLIPHFGEVAGFVAPRPSSERSLLDEFVGSASVLRYSHRGEAGPSLYRED